MTTAYTEISDVIGDIFRGATLAQVRQFSGCETLDLAEMAGDFELGRVLSRQMILIVISGPEMRVLFKIHFNNSEGAKLRQLKFQNHTTDESVIAANTLDYMKELTNQVCGRICRIFQRNNLVLGMSIPLSMHGFYELYTDYTPSDGLLKKFGKAWRIEGDFGVLACTAYVELMESVAVSSLEYIDEEPSNDDDELEFL